MLDSLNLESYMSLAHWTHVRIRMVLSRGRRLATERGYRTVSFLQQCKHSLAFFLIGPVLHKLRSVKFLQVSQRFRLTRLDMKVPLVYLS